MMKMSNIGIHGKMLKWIQAFLTNRTIQTTVDGVTSSKRTLEEGLPQGSALSCTLFLIFINDLPSLIKVNKALFADDLVIWTTEKYPILARAKLTRDLATIGSFCNFWKLKINAGKSVYSIFSRSHKVAEHVINFYLDGVLLEKQVNPVYLGAKLDRQLNMSPLVDSLKEKANRRLRLIKRLATTTWGANKETLRNLYLGYVRSAMEQTLPLQAIASKRTTSSLDIVQNQALRLVCGGMRTTPTAACEIDARVEPLDLRRERAVMESFERYKRFDTDHPNRVLVDSWECIGRLQQQSPMDVATKLQNKLDLPTNRLPIQKHPTIAPWEELQLASIKHTLIDPTIDKNSNPTVLRTCALETIDSYHATPIQVYTDGSALNGVTSAGCGALLKFTDGPDIEISKAIGKSSDNYEAEIQGLISAIQEINLVFRTKEREPKDIVIFTDSMSTLKALESLEISHKGIEALAITINNLLTSYDIQLLLQWIPGHCDLPGNERADKLAKEGANQEQPENPASYNNIRRMLKRKTKEEWLKRWRDGETGRGVFKELKEPNPKDGINSLSRKNQSAIFQLRTGHSKLNFNLNRFDPCYTPLCRNCTHPYETTEHVLFECPGLKTERENLLPPQPTLTNTLYSSKTQLNNTAQFYYMSLTSKS